MDIYESWLPSRYYYTVHLLLWMLPILALQWVIGWRILRRNLRAILIPSFIIGTYLILTDMVAVHFGVWHFDSELILGINPGGVPLEEWLFFYLTAVLVAQAFILFLPKEYRN